MVHGNITFTPDGNEAYWSPFILSPGSGSESGLILWMKYENGLWSKPVVAPFSEKGNGDDSPFVSPDGKKMFFLSRRPLPGSTESSRKENIWYMERVGEGWGKPQPLTAVNSLTVHWQVSCDRKGNLYFGARDPDGIGFGEIFRSDFSNGSYSIPVRLAKEINSGNYEGSPYISPDGDYLIFERATNFGEQMGLFISFIRDDGSWTEAISLSEIAGIPESSQGGRISPDGNYLFFVAGYTREFGVYWVNSDFLRLLRSKTTSE